MTDEQKEVQRLVEGMRVWGLISLNAQNTPKTLTRVRSGDFRKLKIRS